MTTLFYVSLWLAQTLGNVQTSVTTGAGDATHLVDTFYNQPDDYWNKGTAWILTGAQAGKSVRVSDFVQSTSTFTIDTTTLAVGAGQTWAVCSGDWPRYKLWEFINRALRRLGDIPTEDITTVVVADTYEYTLPTGAYNVVRVEQAHSASAPYYWQPIYTWKEQDGKLKFLPGKEPQIVGNVLRITYMAPHAEMDADADTISNYVHPDLLTAAAAVEAWRWRVQMAKEDQPLYQSFYAAALAQEALEKGRHPLPVITRAPRLA